MKRIILAAFVAAAALLAVSCKYEPSLEEKAIKTKIEEQKGPVTQFALTDIEMLREVTLGEEIGIRRDNFELKHKKDSELGEKYKGKNLPTNAALKQESARKDLVRLFALDSIAEALSDELGKVVYRDYRFSASCMTDEGALVLKDWYAAITPEGEVLSMVQDKKNLHRGLGNVIPGWKELFGGNDEQ